MQQIQDVEVAVLINVEQLEAQAQMSCLVVLLVELGEEGEPLRYGDLRLVETAS